VGRGVESEASGLRLKPETTNRTPHYSFWNPLKCLYY